MSVLIRDAIKKSQLRGHYIWQNDLIENELSPPQNFGHFVKSQHGVYIAASELWLNRPDTRNPHENQTLQAQIVLVYIFFFIKLKETMRDIHFKWVENMFSSRYRLH